MAEFTAKIRLVQYLRCCKKHARAGCRCVIFPRSSTERITAETTKNITADVTESADALIIADVLTHPRVRMNGIESVVILTLPMRLREWVIAEARGSHSEFLYKRTRYSPRAKWANESWLREIIDRSKVDYIFWKHNKSLPKDKIISYVSLVFRELKECIKKRCLFAVKITV